MNNIIQRTITGAVYVLAVVFAILLNPIVFAIFFAIIAMIALYEFYKNSKLSGVFPMKTLGYVLGASVYSSFVLKAFQLDAKYSILTSLLICFTIFIAELFRKKENPFTNIAYTILGVAYVVIPMGLTNFIVNPAFQPKTFIPIILLSVFILAWCNDTFAYLVGIKFGKRRLFERISPKKSWEGFFGGVIAVQIASIVLYKLTNSPLEFFDWMILGAIISIIGTFGDLVESMFKRQMGVKDSGNILPGHGGVLDRFDILFTTIPFVFIYLFLRLN
ncbi:MAG: phosphatidate cytidylyltransferase [Bacteroidales bacterium]|jgi:phosphatidate cytidylyltransferase|nr:phosphatidate cytidylyltransferase [Bacteroidales bacterium]MDD4702842.1 phosphatidate cytidylyltransferase [Bacteroidales bacterium]MDX9797492.1 phosphatidate cytidylyltransferase [Bacteroidales bacterium]